MKLHELRVAESQAGSKLLALLRRAHPQARDWVFQKALKERDIKVDGKRVDSNMSLKAGQLIQWYSSWEAPDIPVLYEDDKLLIVSKPAGLNSDASQGTQATLISWAENRARDEGGLWQPRLVHRLDNQTSGLIMLAKTDEAEQALTQALKAGQIIKRYECLVSGCPEPAEAVLRAWLSKDALLARVNIYSREVPGSREIITQYKVIKTAEDASRLSVRLHTGRTHQIRAHMAHMGHPLIGDDKYGDRELNRRLRARRLMLAATELAFETQGFLSYLAGKRFKQDAPF